jgi:hypothetical protein
MKKATNSKLITFLKLPLLDSNQRVVAPEATALPLGQGAITLYILQKMSLFCKQYF